MKNVIAFAVLFLSLNSGATTLECNQVSPTGGQLAEFTSVNIKAQFNDSRGELLENVVVTAVEAYEGGVHESFPGTLRYIPAKRAGGRYEKLNHFDLTDLKTKSGGIWGPNSRFEPGQDCYIQIWLPKNLSAQTTFTAPSNSHCEQAGGFNIYQCTVQAD